MPFKAVTLLGADGKLGPSVLQALVNANFTVTVLKRQSSKTASNYPTSVNEQRVPDAFDVDTLTSLLKGQDAVIITTHAKLIDIQKRVALAAARAGVQRLIPADFGSVDSESEIARKLVPHYYVPKHAFRGYLIELARQYPSFSWTALVCGHFFDWSLEFMHVWPKEHTIDILDDGNIKASASSLGQIAQATVRILEYAYKPETQNTLLYVQSFCKTQIEVKDALERVTGRDWKTRSYKGDSFVEEKKALLKKGGKEGEEAREDLVWWLGATNADWEQNDGFAMKLLGLDEEDIDDVLRIVLSRCKYYTTHS